MARQTARTHALLFQKKFQWATRLEFVSAAKWLAATKASVSKKDLKKRPLRPLPGWPEYGAGSEGCRAHRSIVPPSRRGIRLLHEPEAGLESPVVKHWPMPDITAFTGEFRDLRNRHALRGFHLLNHAQGSSWLLSDLGAGHALCHLDPLHDFDKRARGG